ncbi:MAG: HAD family hydrolase [Clostridia bacterium]|nr:HAD family hydrolase [Clostridia bacterium]
MIKAILFDLDGTLLPMDQDVYTKNYMKGLVKKLSPNDLTKGNNIIESVWKGFEGMVRNDGKRSNEDVFFEIFSQNLDKSIVYDLELFEDYYKNEYQVIKGFCGYNEKAKVVIDLLKEKGYKLILATNPVFPRIATESRVKWAGLDVNDFDYITTYEDCYHSKPNPEYYLEIANKQKIDPKECLMVGNDVREDMVAEKVGMKVFLLTDCLINKDGQDIEKYPNGDFDKLIEFLKNEI